MEADSRKRMLQRTGSRERERRERLNFAATCLKYFLVSLNALIFVGGVVSLAVGIWVVVEKRSSEWVVGSNLYTSSALILVAVGLLALLLSFLGCAASLKEIKCLLIVYFVCMLVIFLMMLIAGILGFCFKSEVSRTLEEAMVRSLRDHYGQKNFPSDAWVTEAWDHTQTTYECCGVTDPPGIDDVLPEANPYTFWAWQNSTWFKGQRNYPRERVPGSCCQTCEALHGAGRCGDSGSLEERRLCDEHCPLPTNQYVDLDRCQATSADSLRFWPQPVYLNTKGCYTPLLNEMRQTAVILGSVGIGVSCLMLISMIGSLCLYRFAE